jgi:poly(3-hydroxybutyrate) depolymerase
MLDDAMLPLQIAAAASSRQLNSPWAPWPGMPDAGVLRYFAAGCEVLTQTRLTHHRPDFGINKISVGGRSVAVREEKVKTMPFFTLLHFAKEAPARQPRILVVAPLSGHYGGFSGRRWAAEIYPRVRELIWTSN